MNHARLADKLRPVVVRVVRRRRPVAAAWIVPLLAWLLPIIVQVIQLFIARQLSGADPLAAPETAVDADVQACFDEVYPE